MALEILAGALAESHRKLSFLLLHFWSQNNFFHYRRGGNILREPVKLAHKLNEKSSFCLLSRSAGQEPFLLLRGIKDTTRSDLTTRRAVFLHIEL